jgi:aspartate kinase
MHGREGQRIVVIKLGGSILNDRQSYRQASRFIVRRLHRCANERFVIVVSAQYGLTDELERLAHEITGCPNPRTLDLLWSTGETRSVAMLTLHLEEMGIVVAGLNIHETGLCLSDAAAGRTGVRAVSRQIERALEQHAVVVVPGFFATREGGMIASLGRGGSDLSAVLLAEGLDAARCELVKDVRGYFTADPNVDPDAKHIPQLSYERALQMAEAGCELVQARALQAARIASLRIVVCGLDEGAPASIISTDVGGEASAARTEVETAARRSVSALERTLSPSRLAYEPAD